jgi:hypothetical protein
MIRPVVLAVAATLAVVALAAALFLNPILGLFGLAATPLDTLQRLQSSDRILSQLKERNARSQAQVTERFAQQAGQRVASLAAAAATVGPVAVAMASVSIEAERYCDERQALQQQADLLHGTETAFDRERCFEEAKRDMQAILEELRRTGSKALSEALDASARFSEETWARIRVLTEQALESASEALNEFWEAARRRLAK